MEQSDNTIRIKIKREGVKTFRRQAESTKALKAEYTGMQLSVLGLPFGGHIKGRDSDGEAFHFDTEFWLTPGDTSPVTYLHGYGPDSADEWQERPVIIGKAKYDRKDERGHWFDVTLDSEEPLAQRIADAITNDADVKASSGAVSHLVRMGKAGLIDVWPVGELAIFDTNEWREPANHLAVVEAKVENAEEQAKGDDSPPVKVVEPEADTPTIISITETEMPETTKDEGVQRTEPETQAEVAFDYAELAKELTPGMKDMVDAQVKTMLDAQEAITAKGAPAIKKVTDLGSKNDSGKELMHFLKTGQMPFERNASKAALEGGSATEGGYLVPDDFLAEIIAKRDESSIPRMAGARVIQTSLDVVNIPNENAAADFAVTAEEGAYNEDEPTFGQVAVTVYKYTNLIKISEELAEDEKANLDSFLTEHLGRRWASAENDAVLVGTGSSEPQGVYVGGTAGLTFDYATTLAATEIPELMFKMKAEYMAGAVWSMKNSVFGYLMGLTGDNFQLMPTPAGGLGYQLMGHQVLTSSANAAQTSGLKPIVFGNWNFYALVERHGLIISRNPYLYQGNGQIGLFSKIRMGGAVLQAEAFQYGTMA